MALPSGLPRRIRQAPHAGQTFQSQGIEDMKLGIFRDELPGERKSIINLLMTGYMVVIAILGYMAFYLNIQMNQVERVLNGIDPVAMSAEEFNVLKENLTRTTNRLANEAVWIAVIGSLFSLIAGGYTYSMIIRPLRKLVHYTETGEGDLPEIKNNNEIKQLMTAITARMEADKAGGKSLETSQTR